MEIIDISRDIYEDMQVYPGDPKPVINVLKSQQNGDICTIHSITLGTHTGTHIDAPLHFFQNGNSVEYILLDILCGPATVIDMTHAAHIGKQQLASLPIHWNTIKRVLFKTMTVRSDEFPTMPKNHCYLDPGGADFLIRHGIELIGIDNLSIEQFGTKKARTHLKLLKKNIVILEGAELSQVTQGEYILYCLPIKLCNLDGAPVRAILIPTAVHT